MWWKTQMRSASFLVSAGVFLAGCAPATMPTAAQTPPPGAKVIEGRTVTIGDTWTYRRAVGPEYTVKVVEVSATGYASENTLRPGVRARADRNGVVAKLEGEPAALASVNPRLILGWQFIDFPVWPGKTFSYRVEGGIAWFSMDVKAVKWEQVTVPAGTFEALRIEACYFNESSRWYGCGQTFWYAPAAKTFVKRRTPIRWAQSLLESDFELLKFTPGQ